MCLRDLLVVLRHRGLEVTEARIRWAMKSGKITRPSLDGSLRFDFDEQNVLEILAHFASEDPGPKHDEGRLP